MQVVMNSLLIVTYFVSIEIVIAKKVTVTLLALD